MPQDLSVLIPKLLAMGHLVLRQEAIMPRIVNRGYENEAGEKGSVITIPISAAIEAQEVSPAATPPSTAGVTPTMTEVKLDQWWEAPFYLTDKDLLEVEAGIIPMQAAEAVKALGNKADNLILAKAKQIGNYSGTAGVTPLKNDHADFTEAQKVLNKSLAPRGDRYVVMNTDTEGNALKLSAFTDASFSGNIDGIVRGEINNKLGARWLSDQNIDALDHTAGTITTGLIAKAATAVAAGSKTFLATTAASTGACALVPGDIIKISNQEKTYALAAAATQASAAADVTLSLTEPLQVALAGSETITVVGNHSTNLLIHRDCLAFASRPFTGADPFGLGKFMSIVDPVTQIALRLEVTREHKRTRFSYDLLCGVACPRPELGVRWIG